jgi:phosphatidylglycerophosphate synthase
MSLLASLRKEYRATLKPREVEEIHDLVFFRPLGFALAKLLRPTPVTPDGVSLFALFWSLVIGYFYWQGTHLGWLLGSAAYLFWNVLDCTDGQLARMRGGGSPVGFIIDEVVDTLSHGVVFTAIAHGLAVQRPDEYNWWVLAVVAGVAMGMECGFLEAKRHEWMTRVYGARKAFDEELDHVSELARQWKKDRTMPFSRFVVRVYQGQRWLQRRFLVSAQERRAASEASDGLNDEMWAKQNRTVLRMAVWIGPTNHIFLTVVCAALGRPDYYLWIVLCAGVPWMVLTLLVGRLVSRRQHQPQET